MEALARTPKHKARALGRALPRRNALDARVTGSEHTTAWALHEFVGKCGFKVADARLELGVLIL